jgi:hypothetical protein
MRPLATIDHSTRRLIARAFLWPSNLNPKLAKTGKVHLDG